MQVTLTDLCDEMNNWFDTKSDGTKDRVFGTFTIENGSIDLSGTGIKPGQYYRIIGSVFNDGVWQYSIPEPEDSSEPSLGSEETEVTEVTDVTDVTDDTEDTENTNTAESDDEEPDEGLVDEVFDGAIWIMYVPRPVISLLADIQAWEDKYGPIVETPFNSESFGGYSYYKGYKNTMSTVASRWKSKFVERINKWRKRRNA